MDEASRGRGMEISLYADMDQEATEPKGSHLQQDQHCRKWRTGEVGFLGQEMNKSIAFV